jgi:hypothetical protein
MILIKQENIGGIGLAVTSFILAAGSFVFHWLLAILALALGVYSYYESFRAPKSVKSAETKMIALLAVILAAAGMLLILGFDLSNPIV